MDTEGVRSDRSVRSHLSAVFYRQKENLTPTDLTRPTALTVSSKTVRTAAYEFSATYLPTVQTEKVVLDRSLQLHPSSTLYLQKQNLTPTDLVRLTALNVSRSAVPTADDG